MFSGYPLVHLTWPSTWGCPRAQPLDSRESSQPRTCHTVYPLLQTFASQAQTSHLIGMIIYHKSHATPPYIPKCFNSFTTNVSKTEFQICPINVNGNVILTTPGPKTWHHPWLVRLTHMFGTSVESGHLAISAQQTVQSASPKQEPDFVPPPLKASMRRLYEKSYLLMTLMSQSKVLHFSDPHMLSPSFPLWLTFLPPRSPCSSPRPSCYFLRDAKDTPTAGMHLYQLIHMPCSLNMLYELHFSWSLSWPLHWKQWNLSLLPSYTKDTLHCRKRKDFTSLHSIYHPLMSHVIHLARWDCHRSSPRAPSSLHWNVLSTTAEDCSVFHSPL